MLDNSKAEECLAAVTEYLFYYAIVGFERRGEANKKKEDSSSGRRVGPKGRGVETLSLTRRGFSPRC